MSWCRCADMLTYKGRSVARRRFGLLEIGARTRSRSGATSISWEPGDSWRGGSRRTDSIRTAGLRSTVNASKRFHGPPKGG